MRTRNHLTGTNSYTTNISNEKLVFHVTAKQLFYKSCTLYNRQCWEIRLCGVALAVESDAPESEASNDTLPTSQDQQLQRGVYVMQGPLDIIPHPFSFKTMHIRFTIRCRLPAVIAAWVCIFFQTHVTSSQTHLIISTMSSPRQRFIVCFTVRGPTLPQRMKS